MSRRQSQRGDQPAGGEAEQSEFRPGEYEVPDLGGATAEVPPEEEGEFEEPDLTVAAAAGPSDEALLAARDALEQQLILGVTERALSADAGTDRLGPENIVGVGISTRIQAGRDTGQPCVTVYVVAKEPPDAVESAMLVSAAATDVPTDVVETGELHALPHRGRFRPAPGGVSIGHFRITAGTLGCLVRRGNQLFILSNNHVLANSNNARPGDAILQPGPADGGRAPADVIAQLTQFVPIHFGGPANDVDAAIAQTSPRLVTAANKCFGRIDPSPLACRRDLLVQKCGRTTQGTRGRITDCNATVRVSYGTSGVAVFRNQIIIVSLTAAPFSRGGDSGSLIMTSQNRRPVGLLFAGSATHTIANPIQAVLAALGVTIVV